MLLDSSYSAKFWPPRRADDLDNYSGVTSATGMRRVRPGNRCPAPAPEPLGFHHASDRGPGLFGIDDAGSGLVSGLGGVQFEITLLVIAFPAFAGHRKDCGIRRGLAKTGLHGAQ